MILFILLLMVNMTVETKLGLTFQERMELDEPLEEPVAACRAQDPNNKVPNIVHYIWFGCKRKFIAYHYLSILSAMSVQNACKVFFHTDCEPPQDNVLFQHLKELIITFSELKVTSSILNNNKFFKVLRVELMRK